MSPCTHVLALSFLVAACGSSSNLEDAGSDTRDDGASTHPSDAEVDGSTNSPLLRDAETTGSQGDTSADASRPSAQPAACPASDRGEQPTGTDSYMANTGKAAVKAVTYSNVGAAGSYAEVVSGWTKATGCQADADGARCKSEYRREKHVEGPLAPFNEEQTLVFAGPIELYRIGIYEPQTGLWRRVAYWDRCTADGLVFAGNKHWYECGGFVESYVTADGSKESAQPVQFPGAIAAGVEVHVNARALCSAGECGYTTGLPVHGFAGDKQGSKLFAVTMRMPIGAKTPAYWILPTQVIRANQYGCNCRGMGSDPVYKSGCGELDVAEILGGITTSQEATTTLYSFQGVTGGGSVTFARPIQEAATFVVLYDASTSEIGIRRLSFDAFDFADSLQPGVVDALRAERGTVRSLP